MYLWEFKRFYLSGSVVLAVSLLCNVENVTGKCIPSKCVDPNTCLLSDDGLSCKCAVGYFGDQCDQVVKMNVVCGKDSITVFVIEDYFKYYNVDLGSVHLANPECRAKKEVIAGVAFYTVRTLKDKYEHCGGKPIEIYHPEDLNSNYTYDYLTICSIPDASGGVYILAGDVTCTEDGAPGSGLKNVTHVVYSLTMMSELQVYENIVRDPAIKIEFTCVYPFIRMLSLGFPVQAISRETVFRTDELDAELELSLYRDEGYRDAHKDGPIVHHRDRMFVQVRVTRPRDFFNLRVDECWATQTPNPNDTASLAYTLLRDGCAKDETVMFITKSITYRNGTMAQGGQNGVSSTVRFSFEIFRFADAPHELYLHCIVHLCAQGHGESCVPECKSIIKREASLKEPLEGLVSYGPIRLEEPERPKMGMLFTMILPMAAIWILAFFLLILIYIAKAGNKRMAYDSPP